MVKSPPHHPQPSPRASRPSFRGRDGRRSRKPGARACRCGQSNGSWASTGPPSGVIWRPEVLQDGSSGWCPIRRHRIPWQRNGVTFSLNTYPDIFPDLRHPLHLAGATTIAAANAVLQEFLPRFNDRFDVPAQCAETAFRSLGPELCLEQILCFKHRRRVAKDNTVRFQLHTLQLLPGRELPSYAGAVVEVLERLDGQLMVRHEGSIIATQEAPPSPVLLRNGHGRSGSVPVPPSSVNGLGERWIETLEPLHSRSEDENDPSMIIDDVATAGKPAATSARKPTFLRKERWKAIQKARHKGMSLRAIERKLGIHRGTINKYLDAEGPPTRQSRAVSSTSSSDTIQA